MYAYLQTFTKHANMSVTGMYTSHQYISKLLFFKNMFPLLLQLIFFAADTVFNVNTK